MTEYDGGRGYIRDAAGNELKVAAATVVEEFQPLDADLTAIAGLSTTAYGRSLLTLANAAALAAAAASTITVPVSFLIDGGGSTITTGVKGDIPIPFAGTITGWTLLADQSGSIVVDLWKDTYANFPPLVGDSITASAKPTITTATKAQSSTLTGWTTAVAAGDIIRVNVDTITTVTRVTLMLELTRSV